MAIEGELVSEGDVNMKVEVLLHSFDPLQALIGWQRHLLEKGGSAPAAEWHFIGRVRESGIDGRALDCLELQHYPGMTEAQIRTIVLAGAHRHGVDAVMVIHRVGQLPKGEPIVLVAVAADRRGPAMRCGQEVLEALKHRAPFWKREWCDGEGVWLSGNTSL